MTDESEAPVEEPVEEPHPLVGAIISFTNFHGKTFDAQIMSISKDGLVADLDLDIGPRIDRLPNIRRDDRPLEHEDIKQRRAGFTWTEKRS